MDQQDITLAGIKENSFANAYEQQKGFKKIAQISLGYKELVIVCSLIAGKKDNGSLFHFLAMPHWIFRKGKEKLGKFNLCNWRSKEISDKFQLFGLKLIFESRPELFQINPFINAAQQPKKEESHGKENRKKTAKKAQ